MPTETPRMRLGIALLLLAFSLTGSASASAPGLAAHVRAAVQHVDGMVAVYARAMDGSPPLVSFRASERFPAASVIKMLIMVTAFDVAESQPEVMQAPATVHAADMVGGSEFLARVKPGQRFAVKTLVEHMIAQSDNTASNALISYFGFARINAEAEKIGMTHTVLKRHFLDYAAIVKHNENLTSAEDMGLLLYAIERGARESLTTVASPSACRRMIAIMLGQEDRDKIPAGLPRGVRVANKTGEITGVRNDVAIVEPYGDSPYVIAILTKNLENYASGMTAIRRISGDVYRATR